jgi:hypothetical protein
LKYFFEKYSIRAELVLGAPVSQESPLDRAARSRARRLIEIIFVPRYARVTDDGAARQRKPYHGEN